jgi:glucose/arabinose dehydrogenase
MNARYPLIFLLCSLIFTHGFTQAPPSATVLVPEGFAVDVYVRGEGIISPSVVAFGPDERLYLLDENGHVNAFTDDDNDGAAETQTTVYDNADNVLSHAVGLAWHEGIMYVSDSGRISTLTDSDGDGQMDTVTPIIEGLVSMEYWGHSNNGIAFGPDGKLYVAIGSTTDHGPIRRDGEAQIMRMNPDGSDVEVFATGFRNPYDLAFSPGGDLFTADNNPDRFDRTLRWLPPEELNHVRQGLFYGFPEVFGSPPTGSSSAAPITEFFPSVASAGLVYYADDHFPEPFRNSVYVAQWGTLAHPVEARDIRNGFEVVYVPLFPTADGTYVGDWEVFAQFLQEDGEYRPVDVTVGPDGALYILEYNQALVYRVRYEGMTQPEPTPTDVAATLTGEGAALFAEHIDGAPTCSTCHSLDPAISGVGPSLLGLRDVADTRIAGMDARAYVRDSILNPNDYVVEGYPESLMYQEYGSRLSEAQVETLIDFVLSLNAPEG